MLKNKNILIGVTGSIAIYKTLELIRLLIKANANVRIIMSEEAKKFITPLTFEAISQNQVLHANTESWANDNNHIHIGKWADIFVLAPATANTINKIANGIADNLLTQTLLAFGKDILLAPAANTNMILNKSTQKSLHILQDYGYKIIQPVQKLLACNDKGIGAMEEPHEIYYQITRSLLKDDYWNGLKVVITGGGTKEKIDDVRYISNYSSGKMANALAFALYYKGADITYISANEQNSLPKGIDFIYAPSSKQMKEELENHIKTSSYLFMVAAVSDYISKHSYSKKLKKEVLGEHFNLELKQNTDILKEIPKDGLKAIGFKAEMDRKDAYKNALKMLKEKNLHAVCLNILEDKNGFGSEQNEITILTEEKKTKIKLGQKTEIAFKILEELKNI